MPDILTSFRQAIAISAAASHAKFAESLDELVGFCSIAEPLRPEADIPDTTADSWQHNLANYRSITEYRLQALSQSALAFARKAFRDTPIPAGDSVCVRVVETAHGSPFTRSIDEIAGEYMARSLLAGHERKEIFQCRPSPAQQ
jgi:thioesterase domain-containing protein